MSSEQSKEFTYYNYLSKEEQDNVAKQKAKGTNILTNLNNANERNNDAKRTVVEIDGITYKSIHQASSGSGIAVATIRKAIKNGSNVLIMRTEVRFRVIKKPEKVRRTNG